ncbi:cytochrome P450 [Pisolithus albus]|nr:cytochrome P450 [Pisolithus albus]
MEHMNHPSNVFARAFADAQSLTTLRGRLGTFWRLAEFWSDRVKKEVAVCYEFIDPILKDALEMKRLMKEDEKTAGQVRSEEKSALGDTLLGDLINCTDDITLIRDEIMSILLAGRDTTATTLTFLIYMLSQHPDVLKRLRAEILSTVGRSGRPTYDDVQKMKYLRAVINETLRLYATVTSIEAVTFPGVNGGPPIYIPPNTRIPYAVFLMHRRKDLWGPDAEAPQFAYNEMSFFVVRLLQTFSSIMIAEDIQTRPPAEWCKGTSRNSQEKVVIRHHLTLYIDDGLWVEMGEADHTDNM